MSVERWDIHCWLTCDGCECETEAVVGDLAEAIEQSHREGWRLTDSGRLCRDCVAALPN